jgi:hypothetical protein
VSQPGGAARVLDHSGDQRPENCEELPVLCLRRLTAVAATLLLTVGLGLGGATPAAAADSNRCVRAAELRGVEVGMTLKQAQRVLRDRAVWWGPANEAYSQSFPIPCSASRAMLIHASSGRVTMVVNERERAQASCTTFAELDRVQVGMSRGAVARLLAGKRFDLQSSSVWVPRPCQGWSIMQVSFRRGRVVDAMRSFYFG